MNLDTVQQFVRILMQVGAGMLVSGGYLTEELSVTLTGAAVSLAAVAWWVFWERKRVVA